MSDLRKEMEDAHRIPYSRRMDNEATYIQRNIYRKMTPKEKWQEVERLRAFAWKVKAAGVRSLHPDWTEDKVYAAVKEIFLYATT